MANYATLKAAIQAVIKQNGNNEITGQLLQQQLLAMVNSLGVGYQYAGIATPATNPGTPDQNVFYLASTDGTYTNFGGLVLADGEIAILKYNGTWSKDSTGAASLERVNQLDQFILVGRGMTGSESGIVRHTLKFVKPGRTYRIVVVNNNYATTTIESGYGIFQVYKYTGTTGTIVYNVVKGSGNVPNYYDFVVDNSDYYGCFIRADVGVEVKLYIYDISAIDNVENIVWFGSPNPPSISRSEKTITFPSDGAFMVGGKVSIPANFSVNFSVNPGMGGSRLLIYNITTRTFSVINYSDTLTEGDCIVGGIKIDVGNGAFLGATLPFAYKVDTATNDPLWILNNLVNVDTYNNTLCSGYCLTGVGMGGSEYGIIRQKLLFAKPGRKYRIVVVNNDYATTTVTPGYGIFQVYKYTGTTGTIVYNVVKGSGNVPNYYDFVVDNSDYYGFFIRADVGVMVKVYVYDITEQKDEGLYFENSGYNGFYSGADISPKHQIQISSHSVTGGSLSSPQGMAYYDGKFVRCNNNLSAIQIVNASTYEVVASIVPSLGLTVHCNTVSFGRKYNDGDTFPLLYCPSEDDSNRKIYVLRISNAMDSVTLVQTISLPSLADMPIHWANGAVDLDGGRIVVSGYTDGSHNALGANVYPDSKIGIYTFELPSTSQDVVLSQSDILNSFLIPAITTTQGFQIAGNRIYQIFGLPTQPDPDIRLGVIDLGAEKIVNVINLKGFGITSEPEGLAIKDGAVFVDFFGTIREFTFNSIGQ